MLADTTLHGGIPQYLPFLAILSIAAAQLVKSLVQSLEQLLSPLQLRDVVRTLPLPDLVPQRAVGSVHLPRICRHHPYLPHICVSV